MPDSQYIYNHRIQTSEIQMGRLLSLACIILTVCAATYFRLNTNQNVRLNVGDSLISTMGLFKATLLQNQCTLSIETFNGNNAYNKVGNYTSGNYTGSCNFLTVANGRIVTDNNFTYMTAGSNSYNQSTILTIDDIGVIRLIGTYFPFDGSAQVSDELKITTFNTSQNYFFPISQLAVTFIDSFPQVNNQRDWIFYAQYGQFSIQQYNDPGIIAHFSYNSFVVNNSFIGDFTLTPFPGAIFPNITYYPRCLEPRLFLDFKPPYVLVIDPFWPIATVYEQGRYKVVQLRYGNPYQPFAWQSSRRLFYRNQPSVCPPFTFEFRGSCVTTCPYPYYYQLRAEYGYCVLTCEEFTPQNETTRVCSCYSKYEEEVISSELIKSCPNNSVTYPYGCYCNQTNLYFDRIYSLSCVDTCPQGTFPDKGLCMNCPARCLTCQIDKLYRNYLQCRLCQTGYEVVSGNCYKSCSPGQGRSNVSGTCQSCTDPNCLDCSGSVSICKRCNLFYAISNNACVKSCMNNTQLAFYFNLNSVCLPMDQSCSAAFSTNYNDNTMLKCYKCLTGVYLHKGGCVDKCPTNFTANSNNYCVCSIPGSITVNDQCLAIPVCPIATGWDPLSSSCISCDFGCLTCYDISCTSCFPGFFLYVAPQGVSCRRKSPLYTCDKEFGWINNACLLKTFSNPLYRLARCLSLIPNCQACFPNSDSICVSCAPGYFNVNNTCIANCPKNTIPFEGLTCIYPEVQNCSRPYLEIRYEPTILNLDIINNSNPYMYYLVNGKLYANDPVGYIPIYQNITVQKTDGLFRNSEIINPSWTCLKCLDGMGLSADFLQCLPCPDVCLTCYMALNTSCLTVREKVITTCPYIDYQSKSCLQNCSFSDRIPYISNGILYCYPSSAAPTKSIATIDSSTYKSPDGSTYVFFIMDQNLQNSQSLSIPIEKQTNLPRTSADRTQRVSSNLQNASYTNGYIYLKDSDPNNQLWIMNVSGVLQNISSSNLALSNTVYGVSSTQDHTSFMKTWLAYIGYIMGLVIICLQVVFIGNDLLYKADNTLILAQSIYFFSFVQLLVGKLLSQFYYGWLFAHFGFFPNFFTNTIPSNYVELAAPNSYKLATLDANIVRNAGWAFSLLLVFIGAYAIITFFCWVLSSVCNKPDAWHPRIAVNSLIGGIQFLSFAIFYWSVANLLYIGDSDKLSSSFNGTSKAVSICFIVMITVYGTIRWFFNPLGGLYMFKRILIATILAAAYLKNAMLAPLLILEVIFCICRYVMEKPQKKKHLWMLAIEGLLHIAAYLLMFLSLDAGVNTIIISIIIFVMIVVLSYSLTEIYLQSQNEWLVEEKDQQSSANSIVAAEADKHRSNIERY